MHRTKAVGRDEDNDLHLDQGADTGTVIDADMMNAFQEELCYLIEQCGLTLNTPLEDETGTPPTRGRKQLHEAIFESSNITDAAIDALTFAVMSGGTISVTDDTSVWTQNVTGLLYADSSNDSSTTINSGSANCVLYDVQTVYDGQGIRYANGPGYSSFHENCKLRKTEQAISDEGVSWSDPSGYGLWTTGYAVETDIPSDLGMFCLHSATVRFTNSGDGFVAPATIASTSTAGGYLVLEGLSVFTGNASLNPGTDFYLFLEYDGHLLDFT
jgi:hypothetical protein